MSARLRGLFAGLFLCGSASALEVDLAPVEPTLAGESTSFSAEVADAAGTAELRWDFGDGTVTEFSPDLANAEHTYPGPGHYPVTVVAQDDGGFASASYIATVHTAPLPSSAKGSSTLLFDAERGLVITANTDNATVTLVDVASKASIAELEVFADPVALALAPDGHLWVLHRESYAVLIIDLDRLEAVEFFRLPYASLPSGLVFSAAGDAYVTLAALGDVVRIDGSTHEIVDQVHVAPSLRGITISGDAAAGDGEALWVTRFLSQGDHGEVFRLDVETLETIAISELLEDTTTEDSDAQGRGLPNYLFSVAVSPDGQRAWVPSKKDNMSRGLERDGLDLTQDSAVRPMVSILDLTTNEELYDSRLDLDDRNLPVQVTFTPLGDWAFVSVFGSNLVELRDAFSGAFVTALRAPTLLGPTATIFTPAHELFALADLGRSLVVFDVADLLTGVDQSTRVTHEIPLVSDEKLPAAILLGKQLFANADDERMSSEGYLSCSSCHFDGFEDGLVWDFTGRGEGFRNTTSLLGRRGMGHGPVHWSGNFDEIQDFENPIRAHQAGLGFMSLADFESGTRSDPLGDPKAGVSPDLDALAAYVGSLDRIPRSPHRNADGSLTTDGAAGRTLFLELSCDECHAGDDFTDSALDNLHDVGTLSALSGGRLGAELVGIDTPTLLGVWQTAPYLHDGSAPTLRDVLTTRNPDGAHGDTASLTETELDQLVSYLEQIDQELPIEELELPDYAPPSGLGGGAGAPPGLGGAGGQPTGSGGAGASEGNGCGCVVVGSGREMSGVTWPVLMALALVLRRRRVVGAQSTQPLRPV